jgi:hypothetical protein
MQINKPSRQLPFEVAPDWLDLRFGLLMQDLMRT